MTSPVYGEGFIIIRPDFGRFDDELRRGVNRVLDQLGDDFQMFERFVSNIFEEIADEMVFHMRYADRVISRIFAELSRDARMCGLAIAEAFAFGSRIAREELDDLEDRAQRAFRNIRQAARGSSTSMMGIFSTLGVRLMSLFSNLFSSGSQAGAGGANAASGIGSSLMSSLSGIGGMVSSIGLMGAIIPLALEMVGVVINLAGALLALPAAAGVAAAAFIPLKIAFNGVGEALSAIWSGDPEKIAEAMKDLAPHARAVVKEFTAFVAPLKTMGKAIQQGFFVPLEGSITKLGNTIIPVLSKNIAGIGWVWGETISQIVDAISTPTLSNAIEGIILTAMNIIARFGPTLASFFSSIIGLISKGLPYVQRFAYWIASLVDAFSQWLTKSTESGKVTGWLDQAWQAGKKLYEVIKQLSIFVGLMFGSFGDEGQDTLGGMAESIAKVNAYLKSSEGQESLHNLGVVIHWVGNAFVLLIASMTGAYYALNTLFDGVRALGGLFVLMGRNMKSQWALAVSWTTTAWNAIVSFVTTAWGMLVDFVIMHWDSLKKIFTDGWASLTSTVSTWYNNTVYFLTNFPRIVKEFLVDAVMNAAYYIGYAVGLLIGSFMLLPQAAKQVWSALVTGWNAVLAFFTQTIPALAANVGKWFSDMWNTAYSTVANFVTNTQAKAAELPSKVGDQISQTRQRVIDRFTELRDGAIERVRGLVSGARGEASKLPDQVSNAIRGVISKTYDIGRDMIYGMINGIRSAASALWNAARDVVMNAWQGAKDALKSKSPSKKWAELGEDSAAGYQVGFDGYNLTDSIATAVKMPLDAFSRRGMQSPTVNNSVQVGGAQLVAYLQISDGQLQPVVVATLKENPQEVALAAEQGSSQLARRR